MAVLRRGHRCDPVAGRFPSGGKGPADQQIDTQVRSRVHARKHRIHLVADRKGSDTVHRRAVNTISIIFDSVGFQDPAGGHTMAAFAAALIGCGDDDLRTHRKLVHQVGNSATVEHATDRLFHRRDAGCIDSVIIGQQNLELGFVRFVGCLHDAGCEKLTKPARETKQRRDPVSRVGRDPIRIRVMNKTNVAIVGLGTVGSGVAKLLLDHGDRTARHAGRTMWLKKAVVRDLNKPRDVELPDGVATDNLADVLDDPDITVVAQLIGGLEPARTIMLQLMEAGKDIVTANKALLAEHGPELFSKARELGRSIAFEAAVAGGIPIVANISQCLSANQITTLEGILNGTSNFIVSQMDRYGSAYDDVVRKAQELGYAEADPTMDVDGTDAAQKLAILAHLAFGATIHWSDIPRTGIDGLDPADLRYSSELGYRIKLVATAHQADDGLELSVAPTLVPLGTPLAEVRDAFNAIRVVGDAVGPVFYHGLGAGQMPTASAVVADLIDTAVGRTKITFQTLAYFTSDHPARTKQRDTDRLAGRYYLRLSVGNHPGALAKIADVLAQHDISISSVIQHENQPDQAGQQQTDPVPLVIMTHEAGEGAARRATEQIEGLSIVQGPVVRLRVKA
ncbi:Homoserine dehydrogenase [Crateriforma conspicua]|uniref:Homoserine dehydrogenase n=2 Tax=Crateriforma conspicua TaxID=2527996 RepID=A0A5C5Y398_9PLAN|nr:Homoserine dehydrogenase [Crateriforma conspicua]